MESSTFTAELVRTPNRMVVRVAGRLVASGHRPVWGGCLDVAPGADLGLDLSAVSHMDASGLGLLAEFVRNVQAQGRRVSIVAANRRVRTLLELTRLDALLDRSARAPRVAA
ncbi:MAG: STAS domain-containing protein [Vicinamibacterales bacterium]